MRQVVAQERVSDHVILVGRVAVRVGAVRRDGAQLHSQRVPAYRRRQSAAPKDAGSRVGKATGGTQVWRTQMRSQTSHGGPSV